MDLNLGVVIGAGKVCGQSGNGLQRMQLAAIGIVGKGSHRGLHFVDHISELAVGTEPKMSRARPCVHAHKLRVARG